MTSYKALPWPDMGTDRRNAADPTDTRDEETYSDWRPGRVGKNDTHHPRENDWDGEQAPSWSDRGRRAVTREGALKRPDMKDETQNPAAGLGKRDGTLERPAVG